MSADDCLAQCGCCLQQRVIAEEGYCEACVEGMNMPLRYECDRCHEVQSIGHPMWKYQGKWDEFTGATWACHMRCGDYTHWKIASIDLPKVPGNGPEAWGSRESWLPVAGAVSDDDVEPVAKPDDDSLAKEDGDCLAQCGCCLQQRVIVEEGYCEACVEGMNMPLRYECDRCHEVQPIGHPMWKYQGKWDEFTGATWACHMRCGDYTHWKIASIDLPKVPGNGPEAWGSRESWLPE